MDNLSSAPLPPTTSLLKHLQRNKFLLRINSARIFGTLYKTKYSDSNIILSGQVYIVCGPELTARIIDTVTAQTMESYEKQSCKW